MKIEHKGKSWQLSLSGEYEPRALRLCRLMCGSGYALPSACHLRSGATPRERSPSSKGINDGGGKAAAAHQAAKPSSNGGLLAAALGSEH
ncbi:MAG: hypothetical protein ACR2H4_05120 [Pyrinomonadaceae bacterium]